MRSKRQLFPWMAILAVAALLLFESWSPSRLFVPLTPDDFPAWKAGQGEEQLNGHPHPNWCMSDLVHLLVPGLETTRRALDRGELPRWDASQGLGVPHIEEVHYSVFYPPAWIPLFFGLSGLVLLAWLHLVIAGGGMLLYLRALGRSDGAALFGALAFALSAWITARLHSFPVVGAAVWLPWILYGLERATWKGAIVTGLAVALSLLAGFPQVTIWLLTLAGFLELVRLLACQPQDKSALASQPQDKSALASQPQDKAVLASQSQDKAAMASQSQDKAALASQSQDKAVLASQSQDKAALASQSQDKAALASRSLWRRLLRPATAVLLGLLLGAPQVVPTLDYMAGESARGEQDVAQIGGMGLEAPLLAHLIAPDYYSSAAIPGFQPLGLGKIDQALTPPATNRAEVSLGIGALGLALALLAMIFGRSWIERFYTLCVLLLLLVLLWPAALRSAATVLPPFRFGNPKRVLLLTTFALSVLAAGGVDLLLARGRLILRACCGLGVALAGAALYLLVSIPPAGTLAEVEAWAASLVHQFGVSATVEQVFSLVPASSFQQAAETARSSSLVALVVSLLFLTGSVMLLFRASPAKESTPRGSRFLASLLCLLLSCELASSALPMLRSAPAATVTDGSGRIGGLLEPELVRRIEAVHPAGPVPLRLIRSGDEPSDLRPNFPGLFGLQDAQAYTPMIPRRYAELLNAVSPGSFLSGSALGGFSDPARLSLPAVDMLGIDVVLTRHAGPAPAGFRETAGVGPIRVLQNLEALPRVWYVPAVEQISDSKARLARLASPAFAPRELAIVEQELEPLPGVAGAEPRRAVRIVHYQPGRLELELDAGATGFLLVSENWHPGWRAEINHESVATVRTNHALIGIPLRTDQAVNITLRFRPGSHLAGWGLGLLGVILLVLLLLPGRRRSGGG